MQTFFYIVLGALDAFIILMLAFKIFRWPFFSYFKECLVISISCSVESFLTRFVWHISEYDLLIQIATITLLIRYLMKANLYHALNIAVVGALSYSEVVFSVYQVLNHIGVVSQDDAASDAGLGIFTLQLSSELCGAIVAFAIYAFNFGYSHVSVPPHDPKVSFTLSEKVSIALHFTLVIIFVSTTYWVVTYSGMGINMMMATEGVALLLVLYMARKRDYLQ